MSDDTTPAADGAGAAAHVLDEFGRLAEVEHALLVDYLLAQCALGHDLDPAEGGATSAEGRDAASAYASLATNEMFHFSAVNDVLVAAGRASTIDRAGNVVSPAGVSTPLCPPGLEDADRLVERHTAAARAVDERYAGLRPWVALASGFDGRLLDKVRAIVGEDGSPHTEDLARLTDILPHPPLLGLVVVTHRAAADSFEQRLLDAGDHMYGCVLRALKAHFDQTDRFAITSYRQIAVSCMDALDNLDRALVQRRLLPAFTVA